MNPTINIYRYKPYIKDSLKGKDAFASLKHANEALKSLGVKYWIASGTLLGLYRDKDFIGTDTDIDFDVYYDGDKFPQVGRYLKVVQDSEGNVYQRSYLHGQNIILDFMFYRDGGERIYTYNGNKRLEYPKRFLNLTEIEFMGEKFPCPDPEDYLEYLYGDWKTPRRVKSEWTQLKASG